MWGFVMSSIKEQLTQMLAVAGPGGGLIDSGLVAVLVSYLADVVVLKDVSRYSTANLLEDAMEAWASTYNDADLPKVQLLTVQYHTVGFAPPSLSRDMFSFPDV